MPRLPFSLLALLTLALAPCAQAEVTYLKLSTGTGFVINPNGNVVTNAHVLQGCQSINVLTAEGEKPATLINRDEKHDLAVLDVKGLRSPTIAPLRWNIRDLRVGDPVVILGFPGQAGADGRYSFKKTSVTSLVGPTGEPLWIQLASVAEKGNSGGPVLDSTGNVIAVISGMAQTYRVASDGRPEEQPIAKADVAITLNTLQDFLRQNNIAFYESSSGLVAYADGRLEENARKFIVPVRCVQSRITQ